MHRASVRCFTESETWLPPQPSPSVGFRQSSGSSGIANAGRSLLGGQGPKSKRRTAFSGMGLAAGGAMAAAGYVASAMKSAANFSRKQDSGSSSAEDSAYKKTFGKKDSE